jgi:hypothetical protein
MATHHNPALSEEPRNRPITVIPPILRESLFSWLESTGRFQAYEISELPGQSVPEDLDSILEPEIDALEDEEEPLD